DLAAAQSIPFRFRGSPTSSVERREDLLTSCNILQQLRDGNFSAGVTQGLLEHVCIDREELQGRDSKQAGAVMVVHHHSKNGGDIADLPGFKGVQTTHVVRDIPRSQLGDDLAAVPM